MPAFHYQADGSVLDDWGEEVEPDELYLEDPFWAVQSLDPEEIHRGLRAVVIRENGDLERITFSEPVLPGATYGHAYDFGEVSLLDLGICGASEGRHKRGVLTVEETEENITLLCAELERTNYSHVVEKLKKLYRKWL